MEQNPTSPPKPDPPTAEEAEQIRKRYRPIPPDAKRPKHERIKTLKCFKEVHARLCEGWPLEQVADFVQKSKKECLDIGREGLTIALSRYRRDIPPADIQKRVNPKSFTKATKKFEEGVDELVELQKLYRLQMERIEIGMGNEKKFKLLVNTTGQEIRIAKEVLTSFAQLKMDLGLAKRHIGQVDVQAQVMHDVASRYNKPEVQQVMNDPIARTKVLGLVERLLSRPTSEAAAELFPDTVNDETESEAESEAESVSILDPETITVEAESVSEPDPILDPIVDPEGPK